MLNQTMELSGLWVKQNSDQFSKNILITDDRFSYTDGKEINDYFWKEENGTLVLSRQKGAVGIPLKIEYQEDELSIWWNDTHSSMYRKSATENTMDHFVGEQKLRIELPYITRYRLMEKEDQVYRLCMGYDGDGKVALSFNGDVIDMASLPGRVEKERSKHSKLDVQALTAMFFIDREIPMKEVIKVRNELREIDALHIADAGYPHGDIELSPLLYHTVALPRLIPPKDAKIIDKKEIEKLGANLFVIDLSARNTTPGDVDINLQQFIGEHENGKYVISLEYDEKIPYGQYIEVVDMVFNVVYKFRNDLALQKYQLPYEKLGPDLQREIRKAFPMALSEALVNT